MIEILECEVDLLTDELSVVTELGVISEWGGSNYTIAHHVVL